MPLPECGDWSSELAFKEPHLCEASSHIALVSPCDLLGPVESEGSQATSLLARA